MIPVLLLSVARLAAVSTPLVLAVGVNRAPVATVQPLEFADDDAAAAVELFGGDPRRTWLLTEPDASSQERFSGTMARAVVPSMESLRRAVRQMARQLEAEPAGSQTAAIIWIIGHGALDPSGQTYLAMADGKLSPDVLEREVIQPLRGAHRVHVIIDACHAASLVRWRAAVVPSTVTEARQAFAGDGRQLPHAGYLLAAASGQKTYEWNEIRSGVFSALVRGALRGAADADGNGRVTYDEVTAYVTSALQGIDLPDARPRVMAHPPRVEREAPLSQAEWFPDTLGLTAGLGRSGPVHIEDGRGVWLTGGLFERTHPGTLWLPRTSHLFLREGGREWALVADATRWQPSADPLPSETRARGPLERALKEGMFTVPFGPSYWRGYQAGATAVRAPAPVTTESAGPSPRRFLPALSIPAWSMAAALGGAALIAGAATLLHAYDYRTTTYQRQSLAARTSMLVAGALGAGLVGASLAALAVAGVASVVLVWAS
jgi:hypothetical protein